MKAKPLSLEDGVYRLCLPEEATYIELNMPGPHPYCKIPIDGSRGWSWNRDTEKPTISPSIKTTWPGHCVHVFVRDGIVEFCADSTDGMAGQKVPLNDIETI